MVLLILIGIIVAIWYFMIKDTYDDPIYRAERRFYRSQGYKEIWNARFTGGGTHYWVNNAGHKVPFGYYSADKKNK